MYRITNVEVMVTISSVRNLFNAMFSLLVAPSHVARISGYEPEAARMQARVARIRAPCAFCRADSEFF
jgi:hypothetical protein